jgi:hypothetical protein
MKIIIVDSGDGSCSDEYMAMLPEGITVRGHSLIKEEKQHPPARVSMWLLRYASTTR